jgi:two-component system phosphate regulon response regulator PhoB
LRVWAVLRRAKHLPQEENVWEKEGLRIEFDAYRVLIHDQEVDLTATEFHLLSSLVRSEGRVLSREQLLDNVWGYEFFGYARTVDTHIHRLRQKIGPFAAWIQTVRGIGYRMRK